MLSWEQRIERGVMEVLKPVNYGKRKYVAYKEMNLSGLPRTLRASNFISAVDVMFSKRLEAHFQYLPIYL